MTNMTPIQQPAIEDIRNAVQIAEIRAHERLTGAPDIRNAFAAIAVLLRHAMEQLGEPNEAAIRVTQEILHAGMGERAFDLLPDGHRIARDTASSILYAQMTGFSPETL